MINKAEIKSTPLSGQYKERIYDIQSSWNTQNWTWVLFENDDFGEWFGQFRGSPRGVSVSKKHDTVLVLTSDYLYQLDRKNGDMKAYESSPLYKNLILTPKDDYLIADDYFIEVIGPSIHKKRRLESHIPLDDITFNGWVKGKLLISARECLNWDNQMKLELDGETLKLTIIDTK
ncbi:hypothetical protein ACFW35_02455 [Fictibacillus sp. NPDC058756]|uniref:hypothetical protein n=1 Tax=Fictibacillus sp. NPDC058756 TaxID=3346625 RepID=UPI0036B7F861